MKNPPKAKPYEAALPQLKALRLRQRLSLQDIYRKTRIQPGILKSIEEGGPFELSTAYLRFFVKAYAKALGYDERQALKDFFKEEAVRAPAAAAPAEAEPKKLKPMRKAMGGPQKALLAGAAILLAAALAAAAFYGGRGFLKEKLAAVRARAGAGAAKARAADKAQAAAPSKRAAREVKQPAAALAARPLPQLIEEGFYANSLLIKSQTDKIMYFKAEGAQTATIALSAGLWHALKAPGAIYIRLDGRSRLALAHKGRLSFWTSKAGFEKTLQAP